MERPRVKSPLHGLPANTGPLATAAWCVSRDLFPKDRNWFVEIAMPAGSSRFAIEIFGAEWGFSFQHDGRVSWIRVTDIPFVHGHDDFQLLHEASSLMQIGEVVCKIEHLYGIKFARDEAAVRTSIEDGEPAIREWLRSL
ncbi:MAG: hypothetical protein M4D80_28790 [Myxococcota bacterium]|nr:hypothetical protein [Myxococcota bacterium]